MMFWCTLKSFLSYSLPQSLPKAVQRRKAPNGKSTWVATSCSAVRWELWLRPSIQTTLLGSSADLWGQNGEILRQLRKQNMKVNRDCLSFLSKGMFSGMHVRRQVLLSYYYHLYMNIVLKTVSDGSHPAIEIPALSWLNKHCPWLGLSSWGFLLLFFKSLKPEFCY